MIALLVAALYTNTDRVANVLARPGVLWAATAGGIEQYELPAGARTRLFTTADGLDSNEVLRVWHQGALQARTARSVCSLTSADVFTCSPIAPLPPPAPAVGVLHQGARETARLIQDGQQIIATDGAGLWLDGRRITPEGQVCANHVEALAGFRGTLWVGTFDAGICVRENGRFRAIAAPFRMVNDLRATPQGLWVAAAEGLYLTTDGRTFRRQAQVRERGINRIAVSRRWLFVTTPSVLYAIRRDEPSVFRRWTRPAGSTALQAVTVSGRNVWLASEDAGVIRMRHGRFQVFDRATGLPSSWAVDVAPGPDGGVWVATLRDGAFLLGEDGRLRQAAANTRAWGLRLYLDGASLLFGTQHGIEGWTVPLPDQRVHALLRTHEGLWVATEGGLALVGDTLSQRDPVTAKD